jgi:hypothetical protein
VKLRYTGVIPQTFMVLGREVQPGEEFDVPIDDVEAYLTRADVETAPILVEAPADEPIADTAADPAPRKRAKAALEPKTDDNVTA